jgi:hypothetical protein
VPLILLVGLAGVAGVALIAVGLVRSGRSEVVRALALAADFALLWIGASVAAGMDSGEAHKLAYLVAGSLVAGAAVHALGVIVWTRPFAWTARAIGTILVCPALLLSQVLALLLPLVGLLLVTLWSPTGALRPRSAS